MLAGVEDEIESASTSSRLQGILMIVAALSIAAFVGAIMKILTAHLTPYQVVWFRFTGMSLILLPFLVWRYGVGGLYPARPWIQLLRGLTMAGGTTAFVIGVQTVDYADAIAILYAYPFLLVIIAVWFLGEHADWPVWIGVAGGFVGVLLVMRPEFEQVDRGNFYIFGCAVIVAVQMALNRKLGIIAPPLVTSFAGATCAALALLPILPGAWSAIPAEAWWPIALLVIAGAVSQFLLVLAFRHESASTLAPFTYSEIVSAVIFGFLFFGTLPSPASWGGILLITAAGIYVARSMHVRNIPRRVPKI